MRILIIKRDYGRPILKDYFRHLPDLGEVRVVTLDNNAQQDLAFHLQQLEAESYDRVVIALKAQLMFSQASTLARYRNLVIHEPSTWFNFDRVNSRYGRFSDLYHQLQPFTLIVTSYTLARAWKAEGLQAFCVPNSFHPISLGYDAEPRDIRCAFVGKVDAQPYPRRRRVLSKFEKCTKMPILECHGIPEYRRLLNRIRFFISADVMMREYMQKNFEALACGCVLVAWRQGNGEEEALGLIDGENCLLYRDVDEALERIMELEQNPDEIDRISSAGRALATMRFSHPLRGKALIEAIQAPLPTEHVDLRGFRKSLRSQIPYFLRKQLPGLRF